MEENENEIEDELYKMIKEFDSDIAERNEKNAGEPPTILEYVEYYEQLEFPGKFGMKLPMNDVYIVAEKTGNDVEYKIYLYNSKNLIATAKEDENGKIAVNYLKESLDAATEDTDLRELTEGQEKYTAEFVEQNNLDEINISSEELKDIAEESESAEEIKAKVKLGIVPGSTKNIMKSEAEDFPEFKGKNVQFGYSKEEHMYVVYDIDTAEIIMRADMNEKGVEITKVERDGTTTIQSHDVVLSSVKNRNNPKKLTMKIGAYGNRILSESYKNKNDGTYVANDMNIEGEHREDAQVNYALNHLDNIQALGETSDEREEYGISKINKNKINYVFDQQEFDDFFERFQNIVGPCRKEEAEELLKNAEGNTVKEKVDWAVARKRESDMKALQERRERINNDEEGRYLGEESKDPRRE